MVAKGTGKVAGKTEKARKLPSLAPYTASYRRDARSGSKADALYRQIFECAQKIRKDDAQPFYKTRDLADAFGVSLSTVSETLHKIQREEGILRIARGSQVILSGTHMDRALRLRAMIGMPIALGGFIAYDPYRRFFLNMRSQLRRSGCSGVMAFYYRRDDVTHPDFVERLKGYDVDTAIWFAPEVGAAQTAQSLLERDVRLVCIGEESESLMLPHYRIQRSDAVRTAVQGMADQGLRIVRVRHPALRSFSLRNERVESILRDIGREIPYEGSDTADLLRYLEKLDKMTGVAIVFQQAAFAQFVADRAPERLFRLMANHHVILANGPVTFQYTTLPDVPVDVVRVDWESAARRVVRDLLENSVPAPSSGAIFRGEWLHRAKLSQVADAFSAPVEMNG